MDSSDKWIHRIAWAALMLCLAFLLVCSLASCRSAKISDVSSSMENMSVDSCSISLISSVDSVGSSAQKSEAHSALRIDSLKVLTLTVDDDSVHSDKVPPWRLVNTAVAYGISLGSSSFDWSLKSDSMGKGVRSLLQSTKEESAKDEKRKSEPEDHSVAHAVVLCFLIVAFIAIARVFFKADKS
ncbi:MAG: hypothetical protein NC095_07740 [Muribaculum sp.]|nr:hypothetical protein [Muribaculum sp.]